MRFSISFTGTYAEFSRSLEPQYRGDFNIHSCKSNCLLASHTRSRVPHFTSDSFSPAQCTRPQVIHNIFLMHLNSTKTPALAQSSSWTCYLMIIRVLLFSNALLRYHLDCNAFEVDWK